MEYKSKVLDISDIQNEDFNSDETINYTITWDKQRFDFLISVVEKSDRALFIGQGNVSRDKKLPYYGRHSWINDFLVTSIFYSDPTLYEKQNSLYWYYGSNEYWALERIAILLLIISKKLHINIEKSVCFGSSGGGTSSIMLATLLRCKAAAINPQFFCRNYQAAYFQEFENDIAQGEGLVEKRIDCTELFLQENCFPVLHCYINMLSLNDIEFQLIPFLQKIGGKVNIDDNLNVLFYSDEGGHNSMPTKEQTLNFIEMVLRDENRAVKLSDDNIKSMDSFRFILEQYRDFLSQDIITSVTCKSYKPRSKYYSYENNILSLSKELISTLEGTLYAVYLRHEGVVIEKKHATPEDCGFKIKEKGRYSIIYYLSTPDGRRFSTLLPSFAIDEIKDII